MSLQQIAKQEFNKQKENAASNQLFSLQEKAFAEFEKIGFPTLKHEEWKYTNLKPITEGNFVVNHATNADCKAIIAQSVYSKLNAHLLVFINGNFSSDLSVIKQEASTITMSTLLEARTQKHQAFETHFGKYAKIENQALNALNTALLHDGAFIHIPSGQKLELPIVVLNIADTTEDTALIQPRNLIVVEKNAEAFVIEAYLNIGSQSSFTNVVNEIFVGENAHLEHYKIQQEVGETYQNNFTQIFQEANTNINQVTLMLDGLFIRNNLHFYMNGQNCNSLLYGLYILDKQNFVDNHSLVDHASPNCFSDEKYKGILMDKSTAVFNGKIIVHPDAQKTNAYQRNQNVLLSNDATVNTKPQLEIFADDVKCTHGATIGQLDEEPMFYMRSRGITEDTARKMLLNAFANDIAEKIKIPELVELLEEKIAEKL